jgi:hypothetical protein
MSGQGRSGKDEQALPSKFEVVSLAESTCLSWSARSQSDSTVPVGLGPHDALWIERSFPWRYLGLCWRFIILGGEVALELGFARPKFGVCVPSKLSWPHLESLLPVQLTAISVQLIYHLPTQMSPGFLKRDERGIGWSRFLLVLKVAPEGCAASSQVNLADFWPPLAA